MGESGVAVVGFPVVFYLILVIVCILLYNRIVFFTANWALLNYISLFLLLHIIKPHCFICTYSISPHILKINGDSYFSFYFFNKIQSHLFLKGHIAFLLIF